MTFAQQQNRLTTRFAEHIPIIKQCMAVFCICQLLEKEWEYTGAVHELFVYLKKANYSFRREALCNILSYRV